MNRKYVFIYILFLVCIVLQSVSAAKVEIITNQDYLKVIKEVDSLKIINDTIRQETSLSYTPNIKDSLNCTIYKYNDRGELENIKDNLEVESIDSKYRFYVNSTSLTWEKYRYTCEASYNIEQYGSDQFELLGQDRTTLNFHKQCDAKEYSYSTEEVYSEEWDALINVTTATVINSANCSYEVSDNRIDVDFFATDLDPELDSDTYLLEDVNAFVQCFTSSFCHDHQQKWDISEISGTITTAELCTYVNSIVLADAELNSVDVEVVTDQTWTESISVSNFNAQSRTNRSNAVPINNTDTTGIYTCFNVTNQLQYGVDQGWDNLTIRFWHNTGGSEDAGSSPTSIVDDTTGYVGVDGAPFNGYEGWNTDTREGTNKPFLEYEATDTSAPTFTPIKPLNNTYYNNNSTIPFINFSVTDASGVSHCWYSFDGGATNSSPDSTCANFTAQSFEGQNDVILYANDTLNNNATYNLTYFLDLTNSSVTLVSPPDTQSNTTATHSFNATMTDNINLKNATFEIWDSGNNLVKNYTIDITGTSNATNYTYTIFSAGTYEWNYYVCDQAGNCNYATSNFTITYDYGQLSIDWVSPSTDGNLSQNRWNELILNVSCSSGSCGDVNTTLWYNYSVSSQGDNTLDYTFDLADGYISQGASGGQYASVLKWNISSISDVNDISLCLYIETTDGTNDNDVDVSLINNESWTESTATTGLYDELSNTTTVTLSSIADNSYACMNVTIQYMEAIAQGYTNFSLWVEDTDVKITSPAGFSDNFGLFFGAFSFSPPAVEFEDRENSLASGNRPYINYSFGGVTEFIQEINTTSGDVPFYTNTTSTLNQSLSNGESYLFSWYVNATGTLYDNYSFFATTNRSNDNTVSNTSDYLRLMTVEFVDTTPPIVTLTLPENATTSSTSVIFVGNFTDDENLQNATLYVWNSSGDLINQTFVNVSGVSNSSSIELELGVSTVYNWNYLVYDSGNNFAWATNNFTYTTSVICELTPIVGCVINDSLNSSIIKGGLNTNITTNITLYFDTLIVGEDGIEFINLTYPNTTLQKISFNITDRNQSYIVNSSRFDLPYISSSSTSNKIITSNLNSSIDVSVNLLTSQCSTGTPGNGDLTSIIVTYPNTTTLTISYPFSSCSNNYVTLNNLNIANGNNNFALSYDIYSDSAVINGICNSIVTGINEIIGVIGLMIVVIVGMFGYARIQGKNITLNTVKLSGTGIIMLAVLAAIVIIAMGQMCSSL